MDVASTMDLTAAGLARRRRRKTADKHPEIRRRILESAMAILTSQGHEALTAREIAQAADCSMGIFYTVVRDMDEVAVHLKDVALGELESSLLDALSASEAPMDAPARLHALAQAYATFARDQAFLWGMLFRHRISGASLPDWYVAKLDAIFGYVEDPVSEIVPGCGEAVRKAFSRALFSAVHGIVSLGLEAKIGVIPREDLSWQIRSVTESVIAGLTWEGPRIMAP